MTPQEAFMAAWSTFRGDLRIATPESVAKAFIAALPEGWALVSRDQYGMDQYALGAQQERERLREAVEAEHQRPGGYHHICNDAYCDWLYLLSDAALDRGAR